MFQQILRTSRNEADVRKGRRDWFRFEAKAGADSVDVYLFDEISWFGISAAQFQRELALVKAKQINLYVNSPGGDVFDGITIYNSLKSHPADIAVTVQGIAASIASVIAMAGDTVEMAKGSMMMIHEPFALVVGDASDMRKQADALDLMGDSIAGIYAERAGGNSAYWRGLMSAETWFSDEQSVQSGLADGVSGQAAAKNTFDLSIFRNGPKAEATTAAPPAEKTEPVRFEDWRTKARLAVAKAQLEAI